MWRRCHKAWTSKVYGVSHLYQFFRLHCLKFSNHAAQATSTSTSTSHRLLPFRISYQIPKSHRKSGDCGLPQAPTSPSSTSNHLKMANGSLTNHSHLRQTETRLLPQNLIVPQKLPLCFLAENHPKINFCVQEFEDKRASIMRCNGVTDRKFRGLAVFEKRAFRGCHDRGLSRR